MTKYACLIKGPQDEDTDWWSWGGYSNAEIPLQAAVGLAQSVMGYDVNDYPNDEAVVEQFVNDGWRFKLLEVEGEYTNEDIG